REYLAMSVPSGLVRSKKSNTGHRKATTIKALRWSVRFVRCNFYCLTYACACVYKIKSTVQGCINSLMYSFLTGQAGQKKEVSEMIDKKLVRSVRTVTGQAGQTGQKSNKESC